METLAKRQEAARAPIADAPRRRINQARLMHDRHRSLRWCSPRIRNSPVAIPLIRSLPGARACFSTRSRDDGRNPLSRPIDQRSAPVHRNRDSFIRRRHHPCPTTPFPFPEDLMDGPSPSVIRSDPPTDDMDKRDRRRPRRRTPDHRAKHNRRTTTGTTYEHNEETFH